METNENLKAAPESSARPDSGMSPEQLKSDIDTIKTVLAEGDRDRDRDPHRVIIAAGNLLTGFVFLILAALVGAGFVKGAAEAHEKAGMGMPPVIAIFAAGFVLLLIAAVIALSFFLAAWGLFKRRRWGTIAAMVAAVPNLFNVPFGTALAIYTFWALFAGKLPKRADG
ncbi:MAG TPA: hypothetical protein PLU30_24425 [Verrucomicrobiae bacterium]|mgnify:CR=1 FL=1|nr:hypothetical protein [Verrucomicrobiae bacterium]